MAWRKWIVRSLVILVLAGCGGALWVYQQWTDPEAVRQQVLIKLGAYLPGARVTLDSARLCLLDGISLSEMHLLRRDDPDGTTFADFATGTIYHDKEKLLDGKLSIRKLVFPRPVLHIIRRKDGTWNLDRSILATPDPRVPVPMIVLQQGTIFIEDHATAPSLPPLEIKSVNLTIKNDPLATLVIEGKGVNSVFGPVQISGSWGRQTGDLFVTIEFTSIPVNASLIERLTATCPEAAVHARHLSGTGKLRLDVSFQPKASRPWNYEVQAQIQKGKFKHAQLPQPLEDLEAKARCVDGQVTVESAVAHCGATEWKLSHLTAALGPDADLDGHLEIQHLPASAELFAALPQKLRVLEKEFCPRGNFTISADFARRSGQWREHAVIEPEGVLASYEKFPYALEQLRGKIDQLFDPAKSVNRVHVSLVGYTHAQPVYLEGTVDLKPVAIDLKVWSKDVRLDDKLRSALPPEFQKLVQDFNATGLADLDIVIHRDRNAEHCDNRYVACLHEATLKHEVFPYLIQNVSGTLEILPERWEFRDFHGTHKGGEFQGRGGSVPGEGARRMTIEIAGTNILLDAEMEAALKQESLKSTWKKLAPGGRINFKAIVDQLTGQEPDVAVTVALRGCEIFPQFFPYSLTELFGLVHYHRNQVQLEQMRAQHGPTRLSLKEGKVDIKPGGDVSLDLVDVGGNPIVPDASLFQALPGPIGETCARLQLREPLSFLAHLIIDVPGNGAPPHVWWDGGVRLREATLNVGVDVTRVTGQIFCRGEHRGTFGSLKGNIDLAEATVFRQTFHDIQTQILISDRQPHLLQLPNVKSRLYGGDVGGEVYIDFGPGPQYTVNLIGEQLRLDEFGRMNRLGPEASLQGMARARIYLRGQGFDLPGLEGAGSIEVPSGRMYNLPFLLDLLKVLNLSLPDKTAFEEAHIQFNVRGPKVYVNQLSLIGNAVSLNGQGTMNLNGTDLNLDFYSVMGHIMQWSPPLVDKLWPLISKQLLKIEVRGSFDKREIKKKPVPALVEPVTELLKLVSGKQN